MTPSRPGFFARVCHQLLRAPAGFGRPIDAAIADREYDSGAWSHFHSAAEQPRQEAVVNYIAATHPDPAILDIGCGSGRLAQLLQAQSFHRYVGLDFSASGLAEARALKLPKCEFIEGDFATWRPTEKFHLIVFNECVGYAHDPGSLVASFVPWLASEGAVIVSHYRSGHWASIWRRIERHVQPVAALTVANDVGQIWDIKLLRPPAAS
jgi:trans-aconitate methyltransferase